MQRIVARLRPLILLLGFAGCAAPQAEWVAMPPGESSFAVAELLPSRRAEESQRQVRSSVLGAAERWRFREGLVHVEQTYAGAKLTPETLRTYSDRAMGEAWSRSIVRTPTLADLVAAEPVSHARLPGTGWLFTYATATPGTFCTIGRSYMATRGGHDDQGPLYDTALIGFLCHRGREVPADMQALFRGLRPRAI